jgi:nitrite reductase/ring-hydroxylating ferredoxin subunit
MLPSSIEYGARAISPRFAGSVTASGDLAANLRDIALAPYSSLPSASMGLFDLFRGKPALIQGTGKLAEGHSKKVEFGDIVAGTGKQVVVCRVDGGLYALDALCPHEGGRISDGPLMDGKHAMCPLHNYRFDPKTGQAVGRVCKDAKTYRVKEQGGDCEIWI